MNTDPLRPADTDADPEFVGPRWPVAWLILGFGAVILVTFASCGGFKA